jgi:hypothetical protein
LGGKLKPPEVFVESSDPVEENKTGVAGPFRRPILNFFWVPKLVLSKNKTS